MKPTHRTGAFARLERSVKRYMNRRSQFAHDITGANISRTLAAELIIGSGIFSTAFFAQNVITGAALIIPVCSSHGAHLPPSTRRLTTTATT